MQHSIYLGYDPREEAGFKVVQHSILRQISQSITMHSIRLENLIAQGLYKRPIEYRKSRMWDMLSDAPMSTQHANARFLTPHLAKTGWALFMDGSDMMLRGDLAQVFEGLDESKALYCVQHYHVPTEKIKMDDQLQLLYRRKNWSSFMLFNCDHPANSALTLDVINSLPGRDLHRFCWLDDTEIGALDPKWNFLVGYSDPVIDPLVVHFTSGTPDMPGYENCAYADEWRAELARIEVAA